MPNDKNAEISLADGYWNNFTIAPGDNIGTNEDDYYYVITYEMPKYHTNGHSITGEYYLVLFADSYDVIKEANEDNNFYFITAENGKPLIFKDGIVQNMPSKSNITKSSSEKRPANFSNTENQTTVKPGNLNSYTPQEIKAMLIHDKKTGKLDAKVKVYQENNNGIKAVKKAVKR
jgi:hypothetical protein